MTRAERERARMAELFGISDGNLYDLGPGSRYGLGTERTLVAFEAFSGVSFAAQSIRTFAYDGRFDVAHGPEDMAFVDWVVKRAASGRPGVPGERTELVLRKETLEALQDWAAASGTPVSVIVKRALEGIK